MHAFSIIWVVLSSKLAKRMHLIFWKNSKAKSCCACLKVYFEAKKKAFSETVTFSSVIFGTVSLLWLMTCSDQNLLILNTCFFRKAFHHQSSAFCSQLLQHNSWKYLHLGKGWAGGKCHSSSQICWKVSFVWWINLENITLMRVQNKAFECKNEFSWILCAVSLKRR